MDNGYLFVYLISLSLNYKLFIIIFFLPILELGNIEKNKNYMADISYLKQNS